MWAGAALMACGFLAACAGAATIEIPVGPYVQFTSEGEVTLHWKTDTAVASKVEYGMTPDLNEQAEDATPKTDHQLTIPVEPVTNYSFRIIVGSDNTETSEFFSAFDYGAGLFPAAPSPYPADPLNYAQAAQHILDTTGITKGVCIVYGCNEGQLAYELAKRSDLKIVGFEENPTKVAAARNYLDTAEIYGIRVTVLQGSLSSLNCRDYSANLIVSDTMIADGTCPGSAAEMFRVLRPAGGVAFLGRPTGGSLTQATLEGWLTAGGVSYTTTNDGNGLWSQVLRAALPGVGEWTHYYANPANTASSSETNIQNSMKVLWYGQPGPRYIVDRHNRPMASLCKDGIIITPGIDGIGVSQPEPNPGFGRLMAFDAYNGTRYWDVLVPNAARVAILRDCGWVALASDYVYVANNDDCVGLDVKTGDPTINLTTPQVGGETLNWGYVAVVDDKIYGSGQKPGASLIGHSRSHVDQTYFDNIPISTSRYLFARNRTTGSLLWSYQRSGGSSSVIINPGIAIGGDYIYFIESRNSTAVSDTDGRVSASTLFSGSSEYLVKLNRTTGAEVTTGNWPVPLNLPLQHVVYLSYDSGRDLGIISGVWSNPGYQYDQYAYHAGDGGSAWASNYYTGASGGSHGEQDQHPVIVGDYIYQRYYKVDLSNGNATAFALSRGSCGTQSGCTTHLFGRNGNPQMYPLGSTAGQSLAGEIRPGCWINMIPAGGLLLIPESASGCECNYTMQASMVFMPD